MNGIQVSCPARVTLFYNINGYDGNNVQYTSANQLIDLYDIINVKENRYDGDKKIFIGTFDNIPKKDDSVIHKTCETFFEYTNINHNHIEIKIKKNIPADSGLDGESSDIVGTLFALDKIYNTNLSGAIIMDLASKIRPGSSHFVYGDCNKVENGVSRAFYDHYYDNFVLLIPRKYIHNDMYDEIKNYSFPKKECSYTELYNCLYDLMPDELKRLRDYLLQFKDLHHSLSGISNTYFIASRDTRPDNNFLLELNRKFPEFKIMIKNRAQAHKLLKMYR